MLTFVTDLSRDGTYFSRNRYIIGVENASPVPSSPTQFEIPEREASLSAM